MGVDLAALRTATRVAFASAPALANPATALTTLVVVPALEVLLFVAVAWSTGTRSLEATAYAGVAVAFGLDVMAGAVEQVTLDRQMGVLHDMWSFRRLSMAYWTSRIGVPFTLGVVPAGAGAMAVYAVAGGGDTSDLLHALVVTLLCALGGALAGSAAATASVALDDPYLVTNVGRAVLMVTSGVVVPLSAFPVWLTWVAQSLPFANAVAMIRDGALNWQRAAAEAGIDVAWAVVGTAISLGVWQAVRDGRREDVW